MLSASLPPFHDWSYLLLATFIAYNFVTVREGKASAKTVVINVLKAVVLYVVSIAFLAGLIWPILLLVAAGFLLSRIMAKDKLTRALAVGLLLLFCATGVWRFQQAKAQGKFWQLSRFQAGSPGMLYFSTAAKQNIFSSRELLQGLASQDSNISRNSAEILRRQVERIESIEELEILRTALETPDTANTPPDLVKALDLRRKELQAEAKDVGDRP